MTMHWSIRVVALVAIFRISSLEASQVSPADGPMFPDGCTSSQQYYAHPDYCTKYFQCLNGNPVERDCPDGSVFRETYMICVPQASELDTCTPAHVDRECKRNTALLIPHPERCQGYYNCSDYVPYSLGIRVWSRGYEKECPYPKLFDIRIERCESYKNIICGSGRPEEKWKCNYYAEQCPVAHCRPCWVDNPTCVGKANGLWPVPYAIWSPYYIECEDERDLKGRLSCPDKELFDPDERKCRHSHLMTSLKESTGDVEE